MATTLTTSWKTIKSYNWQPGTGFNFTVYLEARYTSQDKTGNYSKLLTRLRSVVNAGSGSGYGYGWNCSYCNSISGSALWTFDTETILSSSEQVIYHNADGTKTLTLSASGYVNGAGFSFNISGDATLPTIERVPVITSVNDFNDEDNPIIEFTNPAGFTINGSLAFSYTDQEDMYIAGVGINRSNITSPYTFTLTDAERTKLRTTLCDRKEYTVKYTLQAFNGSTYVGEVSVKKKFTFINAEPTFTSSFVETDANVISLLGSSTSKIVKNASKIKTTIVPSAKKSATIKSVEIKHGTYDVVLNTSPYEQTLLALTNTFEVIVTDSRGYVISSTTTKDLIDYSPIEISQYSFKRVNPTSSNIVLNATIKYIQQTFNSTSNKPTLKWKLGANGTLNTISSSNYSINNTTKEITIDDLTLNNVLPYTQQGRLYLVVNDLLTNDSEYYVVSVGIPVFDYGEFDFQVNGDLYIADRNRQNAINIKQLAGSAPIGQVTDFAGENIPDGWLICDGRELPRTDYADLFNAIGTIYGEGDGSTTFNIPNIEGRIVVGVDENQEEFAEIGQIGGSKYLQEHDHYIKDAGYDGGSSGDLLNFHAKQVQVATYMKTGKTGTGDSGNLQPYIVLYKIIKATNVTSTISENVEAKVIDSLDGTSTTDAPSVNAVKNSINEIKYNLTTDSGAVKTGHKIDGKEEYVKRFKFTDLNVTGTNTHLKSLGFDISKHIITDIRGTFYTNVGNYFGINSGINTQSTYDYLVNCTSSSELKITTYNSNFSEAYINVYYIEK